MGHFGVVYSLVILFILSIHVNNVFTNSSGAKIEFAENSPLS